MPTETSHIADRVNLLRPTAVNAILAEVRALQAQGRKVVSLMRGEPDFRTPPHIVEAATRALSAGRTGYPDNRGESALREAVALKLARDNQLTYDPGSELLVTDGATLGIHAALMALLDPGDGVLIPDPIYDAYQSPIRLAGAQAQPVRSVIANGRFTLPRDSLASAVTSRSRALLLNTPWNPVGSVFTRAELAAIGDFILQHNLVLISDEIYEQITFDDAVHVSPASLSPELKSCCVLINSLSKSYAMTGWRVGYCAAPHEIIQAMFLILQQSSRGPATFVQDAAAAALTGAQDCVREMKSEYAARREIVRQSLGGLSKVGIISPEGGFFATVDIRATGTASNDVRRKLLHDHGVVVAHGSAYGPGGEGTLRVSFASGGENLNLGLDRLRAGLAEL